MQFKLPAGVDRSLGTFDVAIHPRILTKPFPLGESMKRSSLISHPLGNVSETSPMRQINWCIIIIASTHHH